MKLRLQNTVFEASIQLSSSKSESNRALMINAYSAGKMHILNLSDADDTILLNSLLEVIDSCKNSGQHYSIDCDNAGTVYRFLLTYLTEKPGNWILTGTERMKQRPIHDLVSALKELGADIQYIEKDGFPPLLVKGKILVGGTTTVSIEKSSQFASSIVMAAPNWKNGLHIALTGNPSSMPYLDMTLNMMQLCGANVNRMHNMIVISPIPYASTDLNICADWSGAAFWFELVALSEGGHLNLKGLSLKSEQGDKILVDFFKLLGVDCQEFSHGLHIWKSGKPSDNLRFNLRDFPDLLPALAVTCAGLGLAAVFTGLENLVIKESNRSKAIQQELLKIGVNSSMPSNGELILFSSNLGDTLKETCISFESYNDHRIAMALAPLVMKLGEIEINQPETVSKSYPGYWNELFKTNAVSID